ncbi:MAG: FAD-dependent oxidoreductase [Bacteroidota bacterium]
MSKPQIIIIGAGIAGMAAARMLADANYAPLVIDKGRGMSGRMATRRWDEATFDHGAQYFSARTDEFQAFVDNAAEAIKPWMSVSSGRLHPRWIGTNGMNSIPKLLAKNINVLKKKKVTRIKQLEDGWQVQTDTQDVYQAEALLITIPAPQAIQLLENSQIELPANPLPTIAYHPCLVVLAKLDQPSGIPVPGGLSTNGAVVSWMADNFKKGISKTPAVTLHASPEFSTQHLDGDLQAAGQVMLETVQDILLPAQVTDWKVHRWRYSLCYQRHNEPFWPAGTKFPLLFGGDGFGETANVEGAFLSGKTMAKKVLERLD